MSRKILKLSFKSNNLVTIFLYKHGFVEEFYRMTEQHTLKCSRGGNEADPRWQYA